MKKEEYYSRMDKINARISTDRCSFDEIHNLIIQKNYLNTQYIKDLETQLKKQKEIIDKGINYCHSQIDRCKYEQSDDEWECCIEELKGILQILEDKEV